jgi:hypothetical protein
LALALVGELVAAQTPSSSPVRLMVEPTRRALVAGQPAEIEVGLRGSGNEQAPAPKDLIIQLEVRTGSSSVTRSNVTIKAGATTSSNVVLPLPGAGLFEIQARHRELRMGSTFLRVRPASGAGREPLRSELPAKTYLPSPSSPPITRAIPGQSDTRRVEAPVRVEKRPLEVARTNLARAVPPKTGGSTASAPVDAAPASAGPGADLMVLCEGQPLANGKDPATIRAVWTGTGDATAEDIRVFYSVQNGGKLEPETLVLSNGQYEAKALVTATRVGLVIVNRLDTKPGVTVAGTNPLQIQFAPPIVGQELHITERITLVDDPQLTVRLVDEQGKPVCTDEPRQVKLMIASGGGKLKEEALTIASNTFEASTLFRPSTPGAVKILASTEGLLDATAPLIVTWPVLLLCLSGVGGLAGGLLAAWVRKQELLSHRLITGWITGFVFYWAALFLTGFVPLPRVLVLNQLSAVALSVIGGWLGTEVFTLVLKKLGLAT